MIKRNIPIYKKLNRNLATQSASYAVPKPTPSVFSVFNRNSKIWQKDVAAKNINQSRTVDYIRNEVGEGFRDRLLDIKRRYPKIVCIGSGSSHVARVVDEEELSDEIHIADSSGNFNYFLLINFF